MIKNRKISAFIINYIKAFLKKEEKMTNNNTPTSRKYKVILLLIFIATIMCFVPPVVSVMILKAAAPLIVLSGTEWVSVMTMICGFYFGANVWQKKIAGTPPTQQLPETASQETQPPSV